MAGKAELPDDGIRHTEVSAKAERKTKEVIFMSHELLFTECAEALAAPLMMYVADVVVE